jgi:hypothetical protein
MRLPVATFTDLRSCLSLSRFVLKMGKTVVREGNSEGKEKTKGLGDIPKPLIFLVAGGGFEPPTFGL